MQISVKQQGMFNYYEDETQKYFNKVVEGLKILLDRGSQPYKKQLEFLYHIHIFQNYLLDEQQKYFKTPASISISTFYSKAASDILCIYYCLSQGQIISAMSIERNIFESFVNLKLILEKDTVARIKLYEEYEYVQKWNRLEEYKKYIEELKRRENITEEKKREEEEEFKKVFDDQMVKSVTENYLKVKDNYLAGRPFHWAWKIYKDEIQRGRNPSLSFICNKLGIEKMYLQFYSLNSMVVHSEPLMTTLLTQNEGITPAPNFNESIKNIAASASMLVIDIITLVQKYAGSPTYKEIEDYLNIKWLMVF